MNSLRKGQEEIIGFVAIVIIVAIIGVIFLGISLDKAQPSAPKESKDIQQFLSSALEYTTDCAIDYEPNYASLSLLLKECQNGKYCTNEEPACTVLNRTLKELLESSWKIGSDRPIKGLMFNATYQSNSTLSIQQITYYQSGQCNTNFTGSQIAIPLYPGKIIVSLIICTNNLG